MNVVRGGIIRAAAHTRRLINDPIGLMAELAAAHGPTFELALLDGKSVVTGDPALVEEIFAADRDHLEAPNDIVAPLVGEGSLVLANGPPHARKRKLLMPPFHGERMRAYGEIIAAAARRAFAGFAPGQRVAVLEATQQLSLDVIVRAVFGVRDDARVATYREVIVANVDGFPAWLMFLPILQRRALGLGPWDRYQRAVDRLRALLLDEIAGARRAPAGRQDVLALLASARDEHGAPMSDDELCGELRTLLIAGHETTSTTLAWAIDRLHREGAVLERLRAELAAAPDEPDAVARLPFVQAVCNETLRLYPVAPIFRRRARTAIRLGTHALAAGTVLSPAPTITHYDPKLYPEPHAFRPERFLGRKHGPGEFYPFGGGVRRCIGAAFAAWELAVALGTVIREHRFEPQQGSPPRLELNGVTTRPAGGIHLVYGRSASTSSA